MHHRLADWALICLHSPENGFNIPTAAPTLSKQPHTRTDDGGWPAHMLLPASKVMASHWARQTE